MFKGECSKDKFRLSYNHPEDFTISFWQKHTRVLPIWIAYRLILVVYFGLAIMIIICWPEEDTLWYKSFIYYTYWCYFVELTTFTLAFAVALERLLKNKKNPESPPMEVMPVHYKVLWVLYTISAPCALVVSVLFWLAVYNPEVHTNLYYAILNHVFNSVFIILDFFLYAIPYRLLHFYVPCLFSLLYGIFTVIYQVSGGTGNKGMIPIYQILDWRYPAKAFSTCGLQVTCLLILHCVVYMLHILKMCMKRPKKKKDNEAIEEEDNKAIEGNV